MADGLPSSGVEMQTGRAAQFSPVSLSLREFFIGILRTLTEDVQHRPRNGQAYEIEALA